MPEEAITPTIDLFTEDIPLLDVRAPVEFAEGAFPKAMNLPIMNDAERESVGICYKEKGAEAAVMLGHELVGGDAKQSRIRAWMDYIEQYPNARLYCFRGGQRSRIACAWLAEEGVSIPRIAGGYKAMRRLLIDSMQKLPELLVIAGKTGVGKTEFMTGITGASRHAVVDLECRANHRGSAFGRMTTPQPSQIDFENSVAIDLLKAGPKAMVEDEGRMIGRLSLPLPLQERMNQAPILLLEDALPNRVERIFKEYIIEQHQLWHKQLGERGALERQRENFLESIDAIRKRLGGVRHQEIRAVMANAFDRQAGGDPGLHRDWIEMLLVHYYDPMYEYQLAQKQHRVIRRGSASLLTAESTKLLEIAREDHA